MGPEPGRDLSAGEAPALARQVRDDRTLEPLAKPDSDGLILHRPPQRPEPAPDGLLLAEVVGEYAQGQVGRPTAAVPPLEAGRAMEADVAQRPAVHRHDHAVDPLGGLRRRPGRAHRTHPAPDGRGVFQGPVAPRAAWHGCSSPFPGCSPGDMLGAGSVAAPPALVLRYSRAVRTSRSGQSSRTVSRSSPFTGTATRRSPACHSAYHSPPTSCRTSSGAPSTCAVRRQPYASTWAPVRSSTSRPLGSSRITMTCTVATPSLCATTHRAGGRC